MIERATDTLVVTACLWCAQARVKMEFVSYDELAQRVPRAHWPASLQQGAPCAFPPVGLAEPAGMPTLCRLVGRGKLGAGGYDAAQTSDISANELFEVPVLGADPFEAAARLRRLLRLRSTEH